MRIALIGYGKMGKTVERLARESGHTISRTIDIDDNPKEAGFSGDWVKNTDVLIDFSLAAAVPGNIRNAIAAGLPIVVGATGWYAQVEQLRREVEARGGACLYSSNFSLGVQTLFFLVRQAAKVLARFEDFHPFVVETHHVQKLDAPSGTALTIQKIMGEYYENAVPVSSVRAGFFPGTHTVGFDSSVDTLTLEHTARSREGFARGALLAAEWIQGKKGFFTFEQIIFGENHD
ncbi:MAG: dihydrodipicolinate reductase [Acidobacteria bacterium]|nr:MAG: dihydrodipicolinate reductase [Acidobacteriota bacterium]